MIANDVQIAGVISDTHGLLRPEAKAALAGVELIIHAGDVGRPAILDELRQIAPVVAVRGNVDGGSWAEALPLAEVVTVGGRLIYLLHDLQALDVDPAAAGFAAVISGHSHQPEINEKDGVLYLNPGSAGPRRFTLPVTLARLSASGQGLEAKIIDLDI
jgi:putative phosphoesterase